MTLQDDVVGLLMSLTNQTLFTTVSITNSLLRWVVASTPRVAESVATVLGKYSPLAYAADTAASPNNTNNYYVTLLESYSKIINTVMLVVAVWSVLKTAAFVWKSLLTLWDILTTVWTLLTWVAAGLRNVAQRCGWRRPKRDKEEEGTEDCVATDEASHYHDSVPERTITATHTNSGQYSFEQADNQPSVSSWGFPVPGVTWYYQNPGTEKLVPWITPPPVPVPPQAQMIPFYSPNTATTVEYSHLSAPSKPPAASPSVSPDVLDDRGKTGQQRVRTSNSMVHAPSPPVFSPSRKLSQGGVDWSMNLDQPFGREDSNNESSSSFAESTHLARTATIEIPTLVTTSQLLTTAATGTMPHEQATTEKGAPPSDENLKKRKAVSAANVAVGDEPRVEEQEAAIIITTLQDREVEEELYVDRPAKKHKHGQEGSLSDDSNSGEDEDSVKTTSFLHF